MPIKLRIIRDAAAWDALRADWDRLYAASPTASAPLDFVWLRSWWDIYGAVYGAEGLRIITLWRGDLLVGALPLYLQNVGLIRCLRFISTGEAEAEEICPDYLNLLHLPSAAHECVEAAWEAISAMRWDRLEWMDMPVDSPMLQAGPALSNRFRLRLWSRGSCPIANLSDGFEAYLKQLSAKTRSRARQEMRKAQSSATTLRIVLDPAGQSQCFEELIRLHQARWESVGSPGCFAAPRFTAFHRKLLDGWAGSGRLLLAELVVQERTCVVLYGFVTAGKFDLYQLGVGTSEGSDVTSPGMAANLLLMDQLAAQGIARYDFLRGASRYKTSWTTEQRELVSLVGRRRSLRALVHDAIALLARVYRKIMRMFTRRKAKGQG